MKILIHWHPQGAFLLRCISELASLERQNLSEIDIYLLVAPNFLPQFSRDAEILFLNENLLGGIIRSLKIINISTFQFRLGQSHTINPDWDSDLDQETKTLLANSSRDSVYRGLDPSIILQTIYQDDSGHYASGVFRARHQYAASLYLKYKEILKQYQFDYVCLSHGIYDYYVSLQAACKANKTKLLVVNGGHHRSYIWNAAIHPPVDLAISSEKILLTRAYASSDKIKTEVDLFNKNHPNTAESIKVHPTSSSVIIRDYLQSLFSKAAFRSKKYLIPLPILGEVTHHNVLDNLPYHAKHAWIEDLFRMAASQGHNEIYIRPHPEEPLYINEAARSEALLRYLSTKYKLRLHYLTTIDQLSQLFGQALTRSEYIEIPSFGSSISSELISLGIRPMVANPCFASVFPELVRFQSWKDHITIPDAKSLFIDPSNTSLETKRLAVDSVLRWTNLTGKRKCPDRLLRLAYDKFYFFGRYGAHLNRQMLKDLLGYSRLYDIRKIDNPFGLTHIYCAY